MSVFSSYWFYRVLDSGFWASWGCGLKVSQETLYKDSRLLVAAWCLYFFRNWKVVTVELVFPR